MNRIFLSGEYRAKKVVLIFSFFSFLCMQAFATEIPSNDQIESHGESVIHLDSEKLNLKVGNVAYKISLSPLSANQYKISGLIQTRNNIGYSIFIYCALRRAAIDKEFDHWIMSAGETAETGYVMYFKTKPQAEEFLAASNMKSRILSTGPNILSNTCESGAR